MVVGTSAGTFAGAKGTEISAAEANDDSWAPTLTKKEKQAQAAERKKVKYMGPHVLPRARHRCQHGRGIF